MLGGLSEQYYADQITPTGFTCTDCGTKWDRVCTQREEYEDVSCSNCYGEHVMISEVRLTFFNWGEQNGGDQERDDRYEFAKARIAERGRLPAQ